MFDFESGGIPSKDKRAFYEIASVELAIVVIDVRTLEIVEEKNWIFEDEYKEDLIYAKEAEDVHGITKKIRQENGVPLKTIYKELKSIFSKYKNPRQLCCMSGHNISFDIPFLRNFFEYVGDDIDNYVKYWLDTMLLAHMSSLEQINYQLGTCCQINGIDLVDAHRALNDTAANAQLLISYIKRLRGQGVQSESKTKKVRYRENFQLC